MFNGTELWKGLVPLDMEQRTLNGKTYSTYRDLPSNLYDVLARQAREIPEENCLVADNGEVYTFSAFCAKVDEFADYLSIQAGIKKGDHIALMMHNCIEFCVSFVALIKLGVMVLPLPSKFKQKEVLSLMEKADCTGVICEEEFSQWMEPAKEKGALVIENRDLRDAYGFSYLLDAFDAPSEHVPCVAKPEDAVILMFTSGTTSMSKGVVLTNFNMMHAIKTYEKLLHITSEDRTVIAVPIYHVTGLIAIFGLFLTAGAISFLHRTFDADRVLSCVSDEKLTFIHASPTVFSMLLREKEKHPSLPTLRSFACGSSNMPREKIRELHAWIPSMSFNTVYGLTETSSPATIFPTDAATSAHIGSSGMPVPGTLFRVVNERGEELPNGHIGEIQIKGSVILKEYYKLKTEALSEEGWLSTGDLGYFSDDGFIYIEDRKKDMINRGGEKICSFDVENELYEIDGIEEAAVVGIPDELYGEVAAAMVKCAPESSFTEKELQDILHGRIAKFKIPAKIAFVDEIPVTPNGKINKREIREYFSNMHK